MRLKTTPFDVADFLDGPDYVQAYLAEAFASNDPKLVTTALGGVARTKGMSKVAQDTGLSRESLYKSLSATGSPELAMVLKVLQSMGFSLAPIVLGEAKTG